MNFANVTDWTIPQGDVIRVTDSQNRVIWEKNENPEPQYNKPFWIQCNNSCTLILSRYDSAQASTVSQNNIDVYYSPDLVNWTFWGTTYWSRDLELNILANTKALVIPLDLKDIHAYDIYRMMENIYFDGLKNVNSQLI